MKSSIYKALSRPSLQCFYDRLLGYLLRLKGYNNYPSVGGLLSDLGGEIWFVRNVLPRDVRVCIDVGAHTGEYTALLLNNTSAHVYAVEPVPWHAQAIGKRTQPFKERCTIVECAIAQTAGMRALKFDQNQTETASIADAIWSDAYPSDQQIMVTTKSIDGLIEEYNIRDVDFIKLDVEGAELECLMGAKHAITDFRPRFIQVEFHWHHLFCKTTVYSMHAILRGYRPYRLLPNALYPINPKAALDNIFAYANLVFIRDP